MARLALLAQSVLASGAAWVDVLAEGAVVITLQLVEYRALGADCIGLADEAPLDSLRTWSAGRGTQVEAIGALGADGGGGTQLAAEGRGRAQLAHVGDHCVGECADVAHCRGGTVEAAGSTVGATGLSGAGGQQVEADVALFAEGRGGTVHAVINMGAAGRTGEGGDRDQVAELAFGAGHSGGSGGGADHASGYGILAQLTAVVGVGAVVVGEALLALVGGSAGQAARHGWVTGDAGIGAVQIQTN